MRCLVVGGNGFIGGHLVWRLVEAGHEVKVYDRSTARFRPAPEEAEYVEGELGNYGLLREAVEGVEVAYHLVSTTLPKTSNDDPVYDVRSNLVDTLQLLEACVDAGVRKVVFASSGGTVYGPPRNIPITEDHPTDPISSYGITKLAVEKYLGLFYHLHGLDYAVLRISNPYGPYQNPEGQQGAISVFLSRIRTNRPITIWGDGSVVRDYLYVSDLVDALELSATTETSDKVMNIGSGVGASLNELIEVMSEVVGEKPTVEYLPARRLDVPVSVLDVGRASRELGWKPETGLPEGLGLTWGWISA
ncbi:MAG: NAD-dependent epimerase/dehydratase family protein [Rubrobacteraceae bacterium]